VWMRTPSRAAFDVDSKSRTGIDPYKRC